MEKMEQNAQKLPITDLDEYNSLSSSMILAQKRRHYYLRPMKLFIMSSMATELIFLIIGICVFSGFRDIFYKIVWTLFFCGVGMGATMGTLINIFITDQYFNYKAIFGSLILGIIVFGTCNILCFNLDHHFDYWGAIKHPTFFLSKGFVAGISGSLINGYLLFNANGQKLLIKMGF
ncbi:unnamed protein product [Didymodactylos carnosus]|uniref:Uncharacterized protein n=1 Tax=Didymodactylos carnosus TaxID=1234261 RepID=A0A815MXH4_9BILA|nr:unnamed protein product [Didymodactylos carnosus]CAF1479585.1 unnamed protein product [Didymodactylos carnosus]CAF4270223.1 unnamed protein product [Didymodactylos carnosus]CAF4308311.1 unnamed protein product [Didymodactylos carnosus]